MKKINIKLNKTISTLLLLAAFAMILGPTSLLAQDSTAVKKEEKKPKKLARPAFESAWWFDSQTGVVNKKNTLEFVIQHRFSLITDDWKELLGLYGPTTNTRLGLTYTPIKNLSVGLGYTKYKYIVDLNVKYAILLQTRDNSMPFSMTYFGNWDIEAADNEPYVYFSDRYSFFNTLIFMRRFDKKFSLQLAPSFTHYNAVRAYPDDDGTPTYMVHDTWGLSLGMRYKVSSQISIMAGYDAILSTQPVNQPLPSINIGLEIATSNHAFQILLSNNNKIQPQENFMFNQNDYTKGQWLIGFNITRLRSL